MKPGTYRQPEVLEHLDDEIRTLIRKGWRIALTAAPIENMELRSDMTEVWAAAYAALNDDLGLMDETIGAHYAELLRSGKAVPVCPKPVVDEKVWNPGELFVKS